MRHRKHEDLVFKQFKNDYIGEAFDQDASIRSEFDHRFQLGEPLRIAFEQFECCRYGLNEPMAKPRRLAVIPRSRLSNLCFSLAV